VRNLAVAVYKNEKKKEKKKRFPCKITELGFNDFVFYSKSGE